MVIKPDTQEFRGEPPPIDEEWWTALLSEEEKFGNKSTPEISLPVESKTDTRQTSVNWDLVRDIFEEDGTIQLRVTGYNRGGLLVQGSEIQGFIPLSHLVDFNPEKQDEARAQSLASYVGRTVMLKVIECDEERGRVVFSERAALSAPGRRTQLLASLCPGTQTSGVVTNITDFGVFVDLGGIEGLIHVSELSWGRVRHPMDMVKLGQTVDVHVISVDGERSRVALSLKRLQSNPWVTVEKRYQPGQVTEAVITSILPFGAFARLEEGLDGLVHISEMVKGDVSFKPSDILCEGQSVLVRVLHVDASKQRLGLSLVIDE
jgi:small subunit ribosomal protein S1